MESLDEELARCGAALIEERVLRRLIKGHRRVRTVGLQVPHEHNYAIARSELEKLLERGDLAVDLASLPERVILVTADHAPLMVGDPEAFSKLWRAIFHARIHVRFDELLEDGKLTTAAIRERVHRVGQTEFDEIRSVLKQENLLLPPVDDTSTYIEFVAIYLELRYFAPRAIERTFPAVFDTSQIDAAIALDLEPDALLAASRPARAPAEPLVVGEPEVAAAEPQLEFSDPSARKSALRARKRGNRTRAAILAMRSGDVPAAREDLDELATRLSRALGGAPTAGWVDALLPLVRYAATQKSLRFNPGVRLLHDLQAACTIAEREIKVVDLVSWALSLGKRPVVRTLPATREVRIAKRMHGASAKLAACNIPSGDDRDRIADLLHVLAGHSDDQVRRVFRPKLEAALDEVGLHPHSLPERVAEKKLVDEMLDRAVGVGRLTLGDLRDTLSHNDLKLPNLELSQLRTGDQLLRADEILSHSLDGVYRRGEVYMRFLQKISSVLFGTPVGRILTLYLMLPLLGSYAVVEGLQHMIGPIMKKAAGWEPVISSRPSLLGGAAFLFLLIHVRPFRRGMWFALRMLWRAFKLLLFDIPRAIWRNWLVQRLLASAITRWGLKPAIPALIVAAFNSFYRWPIAATVFVLFAVTLNSRAGRLIEEVSTDWIVRSSRQVTSRIVPGLIKATLDLFSKLVEFLDRGIYRVDEWLRFRAGQSRIIATAKGLLGVFWFVITYVLRLYVNLFVEPTTNPIKHFPVVTVAAKIILPFTPAILDAVAGPAKQLMGSAMGNGFAGFTVLVLPGLAGFLVWELKENWKLYRATRPEAMRSLAIGHHGETIASFLRPGFHSGTIPKLYTKLRRAAWKGDERGVTKHNDGLHHVEEAIAKFADRQLVSMLNEVAAFGATDVSLEHVEIGSNRIQITIACPSIGPDPSTIRFELQSGWIVAGIPVPGWVESLVDDQRRIFEIALAGFYKLSAVDIVREQVEHALRSSPSRPPPPYDIADEGMVVWPGQGFETEAIYDLRSNKLTPTVRGERFDGELFDLGGRHALFGREPLYWSVWSTTWQQIARGERSMQIIVGPSLLRHA